MALKFVGKFPERINGIPAHDLSDEELNAMIANGTAAMVCSKQVSLAEFEGMLIKGKLYASVPKAEKKASKPIARDMDILADTKEEEG